ncbi:MAG: hypothetical protein V4683_08740 [Bacteroidota bacterium]
MEGSFWKAILKAGFWAGSIDLVVAHLHQFIKTGHFPEKLLHYIAGGALGLENGMAGGIGSQLLGILIHYFIAFSFAILFFMIAPKLFALKINKYLLGIIYGIMVGAVMTFLILPFTQLPQTPFIFSKSIVNWLILAFAFGLPLSILAYKYFNSNNP